MSIYPPEKKVEKAIHYLYELRQQKPEKSMKELLELVIIQHDLSPKEAEALEHCLLEDQQTKQ